MKTKQMATISLREANDAVTSALRLVTGTKAPISKSQTLRAIGLGAPKLQAFVDVLERDLAERGFRWSGKLRIGPGTLISRLADLLLKGLVPDQAQGEKKLVVTWAHSNSRKSSRGGTLHIVRPGLLPVPIQNGLRSSPAPGLSGRMGMARGNVFEGPRERFGEIYRGLKPPRPTFSRDDVDTSAARDQGTSISPDRFRTQESWGSPGKTKEVRYKGEPAKTAPAKKVAAKKVVPERVAPEASAVETGKTVRKKIAAKKVAPRPTKQRLMPVLEEAPGATESAALTPVAAPLVTVKATPQMDFAGPATKAGEYPIDVWLDQGPVAEGAAVKSLELQLPADVERCRVELWADCSDNLAVHGIKDDATLTLQVSSGVSDRVSFTVRRVKPKGPMYVSVFFRYGGRPCGKITRFLEEVGSALRWMAGTAAGAAAPAPPAMEDAPPDTFVAEHGAEPADIRVEVVAQAVGGAYAMTVLTGPSGVGQKKWNGPWPFLPETQDYVNGLMKLFIQSKGKARAANLKGAGREFWGCVPQGGRELIVAALADGAKTMAVISAEPFVPWELMVPETQQMPLGVLLQIGRWVVRNNTSPPQRLIIRSGYVVSPVYLMPKDQLQSAPDEVSFLKDLDIAITQVIPATVDSLDDALTAEPRSILHLLCHGQNGVVQVLRLNDPDEKLNHVMVRGLSGFENALKTHPLIFLNACEVGAQKTGLEGASGFASSFIAMEASAIVAPLWAVQDGIALNVTKAFYPAALSGAAMAGVFQGLRKRAYTETPPLDTYAAYCFYGDPLARRVMEG